MLQTNTSLPLHYHGCGAHAPWLLSMGPVPRVRTQRRIHHLRVLVNRRLVMPGTPNCAGQKRETCHFANHYCTNGLTLTWISRIHAHTHKIRLSLLLLFLSILYSLIRCWSSELSVYHETALLSTLHSCTALLHGDCGCFYPGFRPI
jgi:hypothetical protein